MFTPVPNGHIRGWTNGTNGDNASDRSSCVKNENGELGRVVQILLYFLTSANCYL